MKKSQGEIAMALLLIEAKIQFVQEMRFHPVRKWRFDFIVLPESLKIAIEIEGGVFSGGRHVRGKGYMGDLIKYNTAAILGWKVLRYATPQINNNAIDQIKELIRNERDRNTTTY